MTIEHPTKSIFPELNALPRIFFSGKGFGIFCLVLSGAIGFFFCRAYGKSLQDPLDHPYAVTMNMFLPAVFYAAGCELGTADPSIFTGLEDFLLRRTDDFDLSTIPKDLSTVPLSTPFELTHIYHIRLVGLIWKYFGVSVSSLLLYSAILYSLSACAIYCIFRQGLPRGLCVVGVFLVCSSPAMLYLSNNLRDFGKTPFILFFLYLMIRLMVQPVSSRKMLGIASVMGIILGFGMGFRQDMVIAIPPTMLIFLFLSHVRSSRPWQVRILSLLLFFLFFLPIARPVFRGAALEGNQATVHSFFQGVSPDVEEQLHFGGASHDALYWTDAGLYAQANVLARRLGDDTPMINPHTAEYRRVHGEKSSPRIVNPGLYYTGIEYARYARLLMMDYLWHFPADIVERAWAATFSFYDMPSIMGKNIKSVKASFPNWLENIFVFHEGFARITKICGFILVILFLVILSGTQFKLALSLIFLLFWFTGYPSIFFDFRHIVYLLFIPTGALLIWANYSCRLLFPSALRLLFPKTDRFRPSLHVIIQGASPVVKMASLVLLLLLIVVVPLSALRIWQSAQVDRLARDLSNTTRIPVEMALTVSDDLASVQPVAPLPGLEEADFLPPGETAWEYVAAVFDTMGNDIRVTLEYDRKRVFHDSTQTLTIHGVRDGKNGRVTLFFPIYEASTLVSPTIFEEFIREIDLWQWAKQIDKSLPFEEQDLWKRNKFLGISINKRDMQSFRGFYCVRNLYKQTYLPIFQLPEEISFIRPLKEWRWRETCR